MKNNVFKSLKSGLAGGILSLTFSFLLNYYLLPMPASTVDNAFGHAMSGLFSGFISAFIAVMLICRDTGCADMIETDKTGCKGKLP